MKEQARRARQEEIEAAAYRVLEQKGYDGLSVLAVARAAKASNETIYRWYGDKLGLFKALIAGNTAQIAAALGDPEQTPGLATLERLGPVLLGILVEPRTIALNRAAVVDASGVLGRALADLGRDTVAPRVQKIVAQAIADGDLAGGTPTEMAETWFRLLIGDWQIRRATGAMEIPEPGDIEARAKMALHQLAQLYPPR